MLYTGTSNDGTAYSNTVPPTEAGTYSATPNYPTDNIAIAYAPNGVRSTPTCIVTPPNPNRICTGAAQLSDNYIATVMVPGVFTISRAPNTSSLVYPTVNTNSCLLYTSPSPRD